MKALLALYNLPIRLGGRYLASLGLSPNAITISSVVVGALAAWCFLRTREPIPFALLVLFGTYLDALDGEVARTLRRETRTGAYLDAMADRLFEATTLYAIGAVSGHWAACFLFLAASNLVSYAKAWTALVAPISNRGWPAMMGREGRTFGLVGVLIAHGLFPRLAWRGADLLLMGLMALTGLTLVTAGQRMAHARALLRNVPGRPT